MFHFIKTFINNFRGKALPPKFLRDCVTHTKAGDPIYRICRHVSHESSNTTEINHGIGNARFTIRVIQHNLKISMQYTRTQLKSIFFYLVLKANKTIHWISHSRHVSRPWAVVEPSISDKSSL